MKCVLAFFGKVCIFLHTSQVDVPLVRKVVQCPVTTFHLFEMEKGILFLVPCVFCEFGSFDELDAIFDNYKSSFVTEEHLKVFDEAVNTAEEDVNVRRKRDMPSMYMGKKKKLRTCANMNGILGGSNAFNYVSFVLAILTLVVNTNNNINNNNNNLNQANLNTASNNNANANSNNNNANVVNVMPPGKKKRRRRRSLAPHPFDIYETKMCVKSRSSSVTGEMSLAAMFLVQKYLQSQHIGNKKCQKKRICQSLTEITKIGLGGKMLAVGARTMSSLTDFKEFSCDVEDDPFDGCLLNRGGYHHDQEIQCGRCGHGVSNSSNIINVDTDQALSTGNIGSVSTSFHLVFYRNV